MQPAEGSAFEEAYAELLRRLEDPEAAEAPLAPLVDRAVSAVTAGGGLDLDRAAALLVAASRLLDRRARSLLPVTETPAEPVSDGGDETDPDSDEELIRRLSEYRGFKEAAALLRRFEEEQARRFPSGAELPGEALPPAAGLEGLTLDHLIAAFQRIWDQARPEDPQEIAREEVTVAARMEAIARRLAGTGEATFTSLFEGQVTRREVVVTFLALLELVRLGRVGIRQESPFAEIVIAPRPVAA